MTMAATSRDSTIRNLRAYPITEEGRWILTLGAPFVVAAASFIAATSTGITWLITPAIVAGPGAGVIGLVFLALSSDTNTAAAASVGPPATPRSATHVTATATSFDPDRALLSALLAARRALGQLTDEQAALRRVATLVAQGVQPVEIFSAVSEEVGRLLGSDQTAVGRFEPGDPAIVVVGAGKTTEGTSIGKRCELDDFLAATEVFRTGRSARTSWTSTGGLIAASLRRLGLISTVASPIIVEGRLWGAIAVSSKDKPLPLDTEERLEKFTELLATAIANAESRSELAASRARIVAASDETRRRVERDLHDGAQQQLVTLGLVLRSAQAQLPHDLEEVRAELSHVEQGLTSVLDELREIARGIHPAILSEKGLAPALKTLARRSPVPVALDVRVGGRLPDAVEVAAYYVVSEMLTNTAKHAQASAAYVDIARAGGVLHISVRDDGVGGADPAHGSGIVGLRDRVEALGGTISARSPKDEGTAVEITLPLDGDDHTAANLHRTSTEFA